MAVTREQQAITKKLEAVQDEWLMAFGWVRDGRGWRHRRARTALVYSTLDALAETRAYPQLGWPDRSTG
jgi:hypothetical protein